MAAGVVTSLKVCGWPAFDRIVFLLTSRYLSRPQILFIISASAREGRPFGRGAICLALQSAQVSEAARVIVLFPHGSEKKASILVIDDEPAIGDALKLVLESDGFEVVVVDKGRDGINQAGSKRFCVGIIDLCLSDMSGLQAIKTIHQQHPEILNILMTGKPTPQAFSEARRLGVVGILAKPFRPADILQLISRALAR